MTGRSSVFAHGRRWCDATILYVDLRQQEWWWLNKDRFGFLVGEPGQRGDADIYCCSDWQMQVIGDMMLLLLLLMMMMMMMMMMWMWWCNQCIPVLRRLSASAGIAIQKKESYLTKPKQSSFAFLCLRVYCWVVRVWFLIHASHVMQPCPTLSSLTITQKK